MLFEPGSLLDRRAQIKVGEHIFHGSLFQAIDLSDISYMPKASAGFSELYYTLGEYRPYASELGKVRC